MILKLLLAIAFIAASAHAAAIESRATPKPCNRIQVGTGRDDFGPLRVSGDRNQILGFDIHHNVVVKSKATLAKNFTIDFEYCPALGPINNTFPKFPNTASHYEDGYQGRMKVRKSNVVGPNTCLTVINPQNASTGLSQPLYLKAQACKDNTYPPASQTFMHAFVEPDDFSVMLWTGSKSTVCHDYGFGFQVIPDANGATDTPATNSNGQIKLSCRSNAVPKYRSATMEFIYPPE